MFIGVRPAAFAAAVLGIATCTFAAIPYLTTTVDELTVMSNGGAKRCARIAMQFIRFDALMRDLAGWDEDAHLPALKVYLIGSSDGKKAFLTDADRKKQDATRMYIYSKYMPGPDFDIAAMLDEQQYEEWMQSLFLLRAETLLVAGATRRYPAWYQIGVSNLLNGLVIKEDGTILFSRDTAFVPQGDDTSRSHLKFDLPALLDMRRTSDLKSQADWQYFFARARDFATYGILTTPERKTLFRDLALLMRQGTPAEDAVKEAFGVSLADLTADFTSNRWRREVQYRLPPLATPVVIPGCTQLSDEDVAKQFQILANRTSHAPAADD